MRTATRFLFTVLAVFALHSSYRASAKHDDATDAAASVSSTSEHSDDLRNKEHIEEILLRPDPIGYDENDPNVNYVLQQLRRIYQEMIRPVEKLYRYADLKRHTMSDADIYAKPLVLLVGPWSTGKSTMINYLLNIEDTLEGLHTGAEPTTGDFTVLSYGNEYRTVEGVVLATDPGKPFASMEKFGQIFLEHLLGVEMPKAILRNVSFIDTPGILENRRQQERGYPYNDVMRWLVHRADLIFVVFDPTKLDVGWELETLFKQLKGKESVLRIILNKADSIPEQELMRVYGALFWSLSPLINVTEPPRVYVGSFWGKPYRGQELAKLLLREEKSLLHDMREVIRNRVYNKIAFLRQHAIRVRVHALLVDSYVAAYRRNKGFLNNADDFARTMVEEPDRHNIFKMVLSHPNVSEYDLPDVEEYVDFFKINPLSDQRRISEHCGYFSGCPTDKVNKAITQELPALLRSFQNPTERKKQKHADIRSSDSRSAGGASAADSFSTPGQKKAKSYRKSSSDATSDSSKSDKASDQQAAPATPAKYTGKSVKTSGKITKPPAAVPAEKPSTTKHAHKTEKKPTIKPPEDIDEEEVTADENDSDNIVEQPKYRKQPVASYDDNSEESEEIDDDSDNTPPVQVPVNKIVHHPSPAAKVPPPPAVSDGPKCNKFRKSCQDQSEATSDAGAPKADTSAKTSASKSEHKKSPPTRSTPPVVTNAGQAAPGCNKYRKSCQQAESAGDQSKSTSQAPKRPPSTAVDKDKREKKPAAIVNNQPPAAKCNKYRKTCQSDNTDSKTSALHGSAKVVHKPSRQSDDDKHRPKDFVEQPSSSSKCNKYRKNCQSSSNGDQQHKEKPVTGTSTKKHHAEPTAPRPSSQPSSKCNKYRKSCQNGEEPPTAHGYDSHGESAQPQASWLSSFFSSTPGGTGNEGKTKSSGNCNKYRKSCNQNDDEPKSAKPATPATLSAKSATPKQTATSVPVANRAPVDGKCNKYRKSCQSSGGQSNKDDKNDDDDDDDDDEKRTKVKVQAKSAIPSTKRVDRADDVSKSSDQGCNKYRKSCRQNADQRTQQQPDAAQKPTQKSSNSGAKADKPKKLCKKSNTTAKAAGKSSSASSTSTATKKKADSSTTNKWRKQKAPSQEKLVDS